MFCYESLLKFLIFNRLQAEINDVVGEKSAITFDDLGKLHYVNQVIKEGLRMQGMIEKTYLL